MLRNVGTTDRIIRIIIGLVLVAYAIPVGFPSTGWNWVGWIGVVPIICAGFIQRTPGVARSIVLLIEPEKLPALLAQPFKTSVQRH